MDFDVYNQKIDNAINELNDMKIKLSDFQLGGEHPKCKPIIINPSTGSVCDELNIDLSGEGADDGPIQEAFFDWMENLINRLPSRPGTE